MTERTMTEQIPDLSEFAGVMTCGAVPVQFSGRVDGHQWYFRARYTSFSLSVAETTSDDEYAGVEGEEILSGELTMGFEYAAGYMPYALAGELIRWGLTLWRQRHKELTAPSIALNPPTTPPGDHHGD